MNPTQKQIGAVLFALIMAVSVVAPVSAGLADSDATDGVQLEENTATIDDQLESASGTVKVVARLDTLNNDLIEAQGVDALRNHAEETQTPVKNYAEDSSGVEVLREFWITNAVILEVDTSETDLDELASVQGVEALHANFDVELPDQPSTSGDAPASVEQAGYETTYGLAQVNAAKVWDQYDTQGEGARIAVLDTGVDASHPDIDVSEFAEFDDNGDIVNRDPFDSGQHGTHTSGTATGGDASGEYIGVAPNAELYHGAVLTDNGGTFGAVIAGMEWAVDNDADVISMSLGAGDYYDRLIDPVRNAKSAGSLVIASSGNDGVDTSGSPANVYDSVAVGATDRNEDVTSFSSGEVIDTQSAWGSAAPSDWPSQYIVPDVTAPGATVKSSVPGSDYDTLDGTSMAAPHVSGVAALVQAATDSDLSADELEEALVESTYKPDGAPSDKDKRYGSGIVDALAAVEAVGGPGGGEDSVTLDVGSASEWTGYTATVDVTAEATNFDGVAGYETMIEFDPDIVQLVGVSGGDFDDPQVSVDNDRGIVKIAQVSTAERQTATLAQLEFEVVGDSGATELRVVQSETRISDANGEEVTPDSVDNGAIEVIGFFSCETPGDVDGDGEVTVMDAALAQQYIAGKMDDDADANAGCADINGDESVGTGDIIKLLNMIVDLES